MKTRTKLYAGAAAVLAVALIAWAFAPRPVEVEVANATRGPFQLTIDEDAQTRLRDRYVVSAPLAGRLERLVLREGDAVQAGDALATILPVLPALQDERTLREQEARVQTAQALVERAELRIERARVALEQAQADVRRSEVLADEGFVSRSRLESDRLALRAAQRELETARADREVAVRELEQARVALSAVRRSGNDARAFVLRAPVSGRVLRVVQKSEATVALGAPIVELGDTRKMEVIAELLTTDALKARPGTPVRIEGWGGGEPLEGRVSLVEPSAFTKISALGVEEQRVNVHIDITSDPAQWEALGDGFRVNVSVVVLALDDALRVPVGAVFPLPEPDGALTMGVFAFRNGRARLVPVEVGGRNSAHAWIRNGLEAGTPVIVYPPATLADGGRVRERGRRD